MVCFWVVFVITRISFVKSKSVISRFCSIHFIVILAGLKKIVRYAEDWLNRVSMQGYTHG